jgi:hypothetical protein
MAETAPAPGENEIAQDAAKKVSQVDSDMAAGLARVCDQDGKHALGTRRDAADASVVPQKFAPMKLRLRAQAGVANPRDSYDYRCGLRLALHTNPSISLWARTSETRHWQ